VIAAPQCHFAFGIPADAQHRRRSQTREFGLGRSSRTSSSARVQFSREHARAASNQQSTIRKENPDETAWLFDKNRRRVLPFPTAQLNVPRKAAKRGVLSMLSKLSLVLTCGVLASSFSMSAQASPLSSVRPQSTAAFITLVRDGCGLGFHWAPCGCIRNYTACPVVVVPAPVVVAPQYAPPVVVTPAVCPYGYYLGPYGRCLPY